MYSNFSCKNYIILLKNSAFRELHVLIELIFWFIFQFSIFLLKESSKRSHFFLLLYGFWEISNYLSPRVIVQSHLKKCLISKDKHIIRKQTLLSAFIWVALLKILKQYSEAFETSNLPSSIHYNHLKKQGSNSTSLVTLNFLLEYDLMCHIVWFFTCLIFWLHLLIKEMIKSSNSQLGKKSSCSEKLPDGLFDHKPRIPVQDFTFDIFINFLS